MKRLAAFLLLLSMAAPARADIGLGLVTYLRLDEGTGTSAADSGSAGHTGTLQTGGSFTSSGKIAGGATLDGSTGYISCGSFAGQTGGMSIGMWVKQSTAATKILASQYTDTSGAGTATAANFDFYVLSDGSITCQILSSSTTAVYIGRSTAASALPVNTWTHIVATWDGTTSATGIKIYVNGTASDTTTSTGGSFTAANSASLPFRIGARSTTGGAVELTFNGTIDDVRYYSRALSSAEVTALLNYRPSATAAIYYSN